MEGHAAMPPDIIERQSLCLAQPMPGMVAQPGQSGFKAELARIFDPAESNAAEQLVELKDALRNADTDTFWAVLTKGLAHIADAQYAFVSKRILVDDKDVPVELPPIGEPGACLMGEAFYINDDAGNGPGHLRNFKYHAYACPCAYMKHDKIFIIPERLNDFIVNNPNDLIIPGEAFLGIPLFAEGPLRCHVGEGRRRETEAQLGLHRDASAQPGGHDLASCSAGHGLCTISPPPFKHVDEDRSSRSCHSRSVSQALC
jgi:hypothetical protein